MSVALLESVPKELAKVAPESASGSFRANRGSARAVAGGPSPAGGAVARGVRDDLRLRGLRSDGRMGRRAPGGAAPLSALSPWRAWRALAHAVDEPHQSGPVRGRLHGLGAGVLAGPPRVRGHRRQDLAAQS